MSEDLRDFYVGQVRVVQDVSSLEEPLGYHGKGGGVKWALRSWVQPSAY